MKLMDYEKSENFDEKYLPHSTSFTMSDNEGGRPMKAEGELKDGGVAQRSYGGNQQKRAKT